MFFKTLVDQRQALSSEAARCEQREVHRLQLWVKQYLIQSMQVILQSEYNSCEKDLVESLWLVQIISCSFEQCV